MHSIWISSLSKPQISTIRPEVLSSFSSQPLTIILYITMNADAWTIGMSFLCFVEMLEVKPLVSHYWIKFLISGMYYHSSDSFFYQDPSFREHMLFKYLSDTYSIQPQGYMGALEEKKNYSVILNFIVKTIRRSP